MFNGASAEDEAQITAKIPSSSHIIRLSRNEGFAKGCNVGMTVAIQDLDADYVLLLNNDTVVDPDFIDFLVGAAEADKQVGIVGAKTYYYRSKKFQFALGKLDLWRGRAHQYGSGQEDVGQFDQRCETDYVQGACFLIKATVIAQIGLFDTAFFAYWEETELCIRARAGGYKIVYEPKAVIWHRVTRSSA